MEPTQQYHGMANPGGAARVSAQAAFRDFAETWRNAATAGEKLVLIGAAVGLLSFLLPWVSITVFFSTATASGFSIAQEWTPALFLFPISMGAALALSILSTWKAHRQRVLMARWYIAIGAAWACPLLGAATVLTIKAGGLAAIAASLAILAGGFLQIGDQSIES